MRGELVRTCVGPVLVAVNVGDVYPQEGIRNPRLLRPVREVAVDDDERDEREDYAISQGVESCDVGASGPVLIRARATNSPMKVS